MEKGASTDQVVEGMTNKYLGNREEITPSIENFLVALCNEGLVVQMDGEKPTSELNPEPLPISVQSVDKLPYEPPVLNRYTDMQDLILLDPVHEVEDTGWPNPKAEPPEPEK
jgi:hypothetical protein